MCLSNPTTVKPMIAEEDIHCYKFLWLVYGDLRAPYRSFKVYRLGEMNSRSHVTVSLDGTVEYGFHTFARAEDAFDIVDMINRNRAAEKKQHWYHEKTQGEYRVYDCVIPKGSEYFVGEFNDVISYTSNQLVVQGESNVWLLPFAKS